MKQCLLIILILWVSLINAQQPKQNSTTAQQLEKSGYVNIKKQDPSIIVALAYATKDNFTGTQLYGNLREAYLHPLAAQAVVKAQKYLKMSNPNLSLMILDAARPMFIQQKMWNKVKHTPQKIYVSNPANGGGLHNYGLAVDITICDKNGKMLDMGTPFDHFGTEAHIDNEPALVQEKRISAEALNNRKLLREVMQQAGFKPLRTEWWHFNLRTRQQAKKYFKVIP